jgi:molybdopterin molybdotransferase
LSTGDELIDDGSPLAPGQIRESNKVMLLKLVEASGAEAVDFGIVRDDEVALEFILREAADTCDAVITSGGVSMGDYDVVKAVLSRIAEMAWMQIAIRPAKPFAFGMLENRRGQLTPIFGLPGNPVSSLVSFELITRPALRRMMALPMLRPMVLAIAEEDMRREPDGKTHWNRVYARFDDDGYVHVTSTGEQGSHQLASTSAANALAMVEDGQGVYAGDRLEVMILADWS